MSVKHCNSVREFESALASSGSKLVVVDFFATWCGPCRAVAPTVDSLASTHASTCVFIKVDVDQAKDVAQRYNITSMPTFVFLHKGREIDRFSGGDGSRLTSLVSRHASEVGASAGITGAGAGVAGGDTTGGNPWARKGFRPPGMAALGAAAPMPEADGPAKGAAAAHKPAPAAAAHPAAAAATHPAGAGAHGPGVGAGAGASGSGEFEVVCEGGVCRRVPKPSDAPAHAAPAAPAAAGASGATGASKMLASVAALRRQQYQAEVTPADEAHSVALHRARLAALREEDTAAQQAEQVAATKAEAVRAKEQSAAEKEKALLRKRIAEDKARRAEEAKIRAAELERIRAAKHTK